MNTFDEALRQFKRDGSFIYQNASLDVDNIKALQKSLEELDSTKTYQFHLNGVELLTPKDAQHRFFSRDKFEFEKELLGILASKLSWSSIKIERVYFQQTSETTHHLSEDFHRRLLVHLMPHKTLTALSLDTFCLTAEGCKLLIDFLAKNAYLQYLSLGLTVRKSLESPEPDWKELGLALAAHRRLTQVNFENTELNNSNCSGLIKLAENNYQTNIIFPQLRFWDETALEIYLFKEYKALTDRLKETPEQRFINDHLSGKSIFTLAFRTLLNIGLMQSRTWQDNVYLRKNKEKKLLDRFAYLVGAQNPQTISDARKKYELFPKVYRNNKEYLENNLSLLQLTLSNKYSEYSKYSNSNQSVAAFFLDQVYGDRNVPALQLLLDAKADLFESPANVKEAFFVKALQNNDRHMMPFRKALLKHVILSYAGEMESIEKNLSNQPELIDLYQLFIRCLAGYACILQAKESKNRFIKVLKKLFHVLILRDTAEKRAEEFAAIKIHLNQSIQSLVTNGNTEPGNDEFKKAKISFEKIMEISEHAKKGFFKKSCLHEMAMELSKAFINALDKRKNNVTTQYGAITKGKSVLKENIEHKIQAKQVCRELDIEQCGKLFKPHRVSSQNRETFYDLDNETAEMSTVFSYRP
ncbi:MAG: hypothetical protein RLZZ225_1060 [Pseudomonadota bacterium]|jgi:hypothetical protein